MRRATQGLLAVTGVAVVGIGLFHLILGGAAVIGGSPLNATAQGEHRFFAALFACYGAACRWCVPAVETTKRQITIPAATSLVGGLAPLLSKAISGPPKAFYSVMFVIELALPMVLFLLVSRLPQSS
jgi:Domain of unknown function (DUF4345)